MDPAAAGISEEITQAVILLTRAKDNECGGYYEAIRNSHIALAAKLADIEDNTDPDGPVGRRKPAKACGQEQKRPAAAGLQTRSELPSRSARAVTTAARRSLRGS
ncbi:hypothetical protein [Paenarthrobacter nicotinovorans]|uniref:hypothetical protein n=1 Tax=Paenarthrobacter nicotinovorans TaxID=29320 RepID=UPI0011A1D51F|nr:hypothetical protein [Paenarthrobacter nicotinovorans]